MKNKVCHVGFTASDSDRLRVNKVMSFLEALGESTRSWRILDQDTLDLNWFGRVDQGRDFLAEQSEYDIVLLHFLWRPNNMARHMPPCAEMLTSPLHSWSNWRKRLLQTKARYIFPFGGTTEISGSFVSLLEGYDLYGPHNVAAFRAFDADADFWCFARSDAPQPQTSDTLKHYTPLLQQVPS